METLHLSETLAAANQSKQRLKPKNVLRTVTAVKTLNLASLKETAKFERQDTCKYSSPHLCKAALKINDDKSVTCV
jgi:hypothetical protein